MKMIELCQCPNYLETIIDWNLKAWPKPERTREEVKQRIFGEGVRNKLPQTLILEGNNEPLGYSTLVFYEKGVALGRLHWIDAVYVKPERRKMGLGSKLILAAEKKAAELNLSDLFALTDVSTLYLKLGWTIVETHSDGIIVSKKVSKKFPSRGGDDALC
jgi:N-acetylglutamate synthase-like GNAT family acetyltransferase